MTALSTQRVKSGKQKGSGGTKYFLEPIVSAPKRKRFCTIDIESKAGDTQAPGFTRPFLVGLFDPDKVKYEEFRDEPHLRDREWQRRHILPGGCIDKLLCRILSKEFLGCVFYSHAGGSFDELFLLTWLQEHREEFDFEVVPIQSTIQVIRVWRRPEDPDQPITERWEFLDSMRLIPMSLQKAAETFIPKMKDESRGKVDHDLGMHEDDSRWSYYLRTDCIVLATVMTYLYEMIEERLGGEVGITAPATAMKLFRRKHMGRDGVPERIARYQHWYECNDDQCHGCAHEWIRRGYYGGRTEIFRTRGTNLRYFDINSSYVASMRELMPIGDRFVEHGRLDWRRHPSRGGHSSGFVECLVYVPPDCPVPPLPHRNVETGKLIFPTGYFYGVWSTEELLLLDDPFVNGRIEKVEKAVWFRLLPMFEHMVDELWKLRNKDLPGFDEGLSALAKLLGNSTYGKFAMRPERSSLVFTKEVDLNHCYLCGEDLKRARTSRQNTCVDCDGSKPADGDIDSELWYQAHHVDASYIIPAVSSHITALSRIKLWHYMKMAVERGGNLYYCDTDSVITDVDLPTSNFLGALKDEYPGEELTYLAVQPKVYMIERTKLNRDVDRRRLLVSAALSSVPLDGPGSLPVVPDASTLDGTYARKAIDLSTLSKDDRTEQEKRLELEAAEDIEAFRRLSAPDRRVEIGEEGSGVFIDAPLDVSTLDRVTFGRKNYLLELEYKVTMKGFPGRSHTKYVHEDGREEWTMTTVRNKDNLERLVAGETLEWRRLEKVRSLARAGFQRPPEMVTVTKSFKSKYDKRVLDALTGTTTAVILDERTGAQGTQAAAE